MLAVPITPARTNKLFPALPPDRSIRLNKTVKKSDRIFADGWQFARRDHPTTPLQRKTPERFSTRSGV
jgi:hypothetical protein